MIRLTIVSAVALMLNVSVGVLGANAQDSMHQGPSKQVYLKCAAECQKSFYFSEQSDPTFADLRTACIEGCGMVEEANMSAYQSCNAECKDLFPYRHGTNPEFADFQQTCIVGCRRVH